MPEHEEIEEHIHHAQEPFDKVVAGSMAIIAALLAVVSVLGQHFNTETLLKQQESSDQWAFYQAKNIRRYSAQMGQDVLTELKAPAGKVEKYLKDGEKYDEQMKDIQKEATQLKKESVLADARSARFHGGEVFLEVGIVLSSLAILTKRKPFFFGGVLMALGGVIYAATALMA
jgi:uncharacterized protein DUF4337